MNISIRKRIYWSFFLLVSLFVINGIITINTLNRIKNLSIHLSKVVEPSLQTLDDFQTMMLESKMYTTNWVFLRSKQEDKELLKKLHSTDYQKLKLRLSSYASQWNSKKWTDSLNSIYTDFEKILIIEKDIMSSLNKFNDYDDPVLKLEAERKLEEEVLPRTASVMATLSNIHSHFKNIRSQENNYLEGASLRLSTFIVILALTIILAGLLLSTYMTRIILAPINKIKCIVNDLGKGIIRKINHPANKDEIGEMIRSVNNLSENLRQTTTFAQEVGLRNFDIPFQPLSNEDTLGKALITMRDNLKKSEKRLLESTTDLIERNKDLEQFTFVVSHNLRAPVANIMGLSYVLNTMKDIDPQQKDRLLKELATSVKKLDDMIIELNRILQLRREKQENRETISLSSLLTDAQFGNGYISEEQKQQL